MTKTQTQMKQAARTYHCPHCDVWHLTSKSQEPSS